MKREGDIKTREFSGVFRLKSFSELNTLELYEILRIRQEVFVVEQECAFLDNDRFDYECYHLFWMEDLPECEKHMTAYARIVPPGVIYEMASIGRVMTVAAHRRKGLGREIFLHALQSCEALFGNVEIKIQAQSYLLPFYESFGFESISEAYLDTGILHNDMVRYSRRNEET